MSVQSVSTLDSGAILRGVAAAAAAGGALDLAYAFGRASLSGAGPMRVLQSIASGWQGRSAFSGGAASATLGMVTHFAIATAMALVLAIALLRWPAASERALAVGGAYGLALYGVMYHGVLPLRWPEIYPRFDGLGSVADVLIHVAVGLVFGGVLARMLPR